MAYKKIQTFIIVLSFLALFLLGAQQEGCKKETPGPKFNTTALTISFIDRAPPTQINLGTTFPIYIKAENKGGYDIEPGKAKFFLYGIGNNLRNVNTFMLNQNKISKETPQQEAGFEIIKFAENAESALIINNPFNLTMRVDACYDYTTQTQATICIGQGDSLCPISGEKIVTGANTNAPIQVTSLTEQVQGNKIYVSFLIQNKGDGEVYYSDMDCNKLYGQDSSEIIKQQLKKNYVEIFIDTGTESDLKCNLLTPGGGQVIGTSGMVPIGTKISCSKIIGQQTYSVPIKINLAYKYINSISKTITILP